jgi:hypothetical protein
MTKDERLKLFFVPIGTVFVILSIAIICTSFQEAISPNITAVVHNQEPFPIHEGKVIVGSKAIPVEDFRRLVEVSVQQISSNNTLEKKVEQVLDVNIEESHLPKVVYDQQIVYKEIDPKFNQYLTDIIEAYHQNTLLAHRLLRVYQKNRHDQEFMQKVEDFADENQ